MLLYAVTQRTLLPGDESDRRAALLALARAWARGGVAYLQIREKDLPLPELQALAASLVAAVRAENSSLRVLLNGPAEVALQAGCDGVHLHSDAPPAAVQAAQRVYGRAGQPLLLSAACHNLAEIERQRAAADLLLFSPVFEKVAPAQILRGVGLAVLAQAVETARGTRVLALGGVTAQNARACIAAGAAGIAAIRLFLNHEDWKPLIAARSTPDRHPERP
jgi:thiamine-phosphate pyrophosphorylase